MSNLSLLTIVRGQQQQLHHLLRGVAEQHSRPREVVIVFINEPIPDRLPDPGCPVYPFQISETQQRLPLAAARNYAAARAAGEVLAFLDADCIPGENYLTRLDHAVNLTHGLVMADMRYLSRPLEGNWTYSALERVSVRHPDYPALPRDHGLAPLGYPLFRAAAFGIRAREFARLGGFDESFTGHGSEEIDLSFTARKARLPAYLCNARAYHQHRSAHYPPFDRLNEIVDSAEQFYQKWNFWPMESVLKQFRKAGLIEWNADNIEIVQQPNREILDASVSDLPF